MAAGDRGRGIRDRAAPAVRADSDPAAVQEAGCDGSGVLRSCTTPAAEFPPECRNADYEKRIQAAYPIHPEVFDRLY